MCTFVCFQITATDNICIVKDRTYRKLIIKNCTEDDAGKYRCEADGRKTEALLKVEGTTLRIQKFGLKDSLIQCCVSETDFARSSEIER